ncbi:HEXXH motif-containing putative peptide modification protein [Chitinimonas sp. BJB300]|uniref:HEXXH motif-containing putative peptide modification protein n=1 Tax=Chitinimonas sp. BJB300 TaxID=1559339 RepID=UPI000C0FB1BF|nr:HEXXH motif-containing putative peptide modification protein [Chitinimonas sp. BJB300]PHV11182.1 hypothetical protein CSQ89_12310 [Chitinimonas sp. BJB300]TSJ87416.1 hypothetical protein FG002_014405 [Chitinimonas sp. BJB300]
MSTTQIYYLLQWPTNTPPFACDILDEHVLQLTHWLKEASWIVQSDTSQDNPVLMPAGLTEQALNKALLAPHLCRIFSLSGSTLGLDDCKETLRAYFAHASELQTRTISPEYLLGGEIEIDFDSVHCRRIEAESSVLCRPPGQMSDADRALTLEKLHAAMAMVNKVAGTAGAMIRSVTRAIRIRCTEGDVTAAETDPRDIGEIRLLNPHLPKTRVVDLADALIHESLHNFLAMYENRQGSFVGYEQTAMMRPVSPWTGNPIPYNAFTHAVFIYFGLFHFYRLLYASSDDPQLRTEAAELIAKCARGFRVAELDKCLKLIGDSPSWVFALYRKMSVDVRNVYSSNTALVLV